MLPMTPKAKLLSFRSTDRRISNVSPVRAVEAIMLPDERSMMNQMNMLQSFSHSPLFASHCWPELDNEPTAAAVVCLAGVIRLIEGAMHEQLLKASLELPGIGS